MNTVLLYTCKDSNNTIGKALESPVTFDSVLFKESTNVIEPVVTFKGDETIFSKNYAYIPTFNRYYFITGIKVFPANFYELSLKVDVLESFKNDILSSSGFISKSTDINPYYNGDYENEVRKEIDIYSSDVTIDIETTSRILVTVGGVS